MPSDPDAPLVLVVEDDEAVAAAERDILTDEGYRVAVLPSADLPTVTQLAPSLILLDVVINGTASGWDLLRALKTDPATTQIPILVVTAASAREIAAVQTELDTWDCTVLAKPFDLDEFVTAARTRLTTSPAGESVDSSQDGLAG